MAQQRIIHTNFTAGEVSPEIKGRVDIDRYPNGCDELYNFMVQVTGGATRRPGSYYAGAAKNPTLTARLFKLKVSSFVAYVLEFGEGYVRFFRNRGPVMVAGVPVELALPYTRYDLAALRFAQSGDTVYIAHENYPPRMIQRTGVSTFTTSEVVFSNGPWDKENTSLVTMTAGAASTVGSTTVTASSATFLPTDVGRMIALYDEAQERGGGHKSGTYSATAYAKGAVFFCEDRGIRRVYRVVVAGTTAAFDGSGTTPPYDLAAPTDEGDYVKDGTCRLQYLGRGKSCWGWGTITAYTSPTSVTVAVVDTYANSGATGGAISRRGFPNNRESTTFASTGATARWKMGAWGVANGYPRTACFYQQRLWWGGSVAFPQTVWSSQSGDFYNMAPTEPDGAVIDTNAIVYGLDDDESNSILWMLSVFKGISVGTASGEFLLGPSSAANQAVSPSNFYARRAGDRGSNTSVPALRAGSAALFVQRGGRKLREMVFDLATDAYKAIPASLLSKHITGLGVVDMALSEEPEGALWLVREDGLLGTLTYDPEQQVRGWARQELTGGVVESLSVIPSPDGTADDIYMLVKRTIGGAEVRYIEVVRAGFRSDADGDSGGFFVDCGLTYDGTPATTFSGLDHLEGETVQICADGAYRGTSVVSGGAVSISEPAASMVHIGLGYESRLTPLPVEAGAQGGTAQAAMKRTTDMYVRVYETRGGVVGTNGVYENLFQRDPDALTGVATPLKSTDLRKMPFPGTWERTGSITIKQSEPLPMTILAIVRTVTTNA